MLEVTPKMGGTRGVPRKGGAVGDKGGDQEGGSMNFFQQLMLFKNKSKKHITEAL